MGPLLTLNDIGFVAPRSVRAAQMWQQQLHARLQRARYLHHDEGAGDGRRYDSRQLTHIVVICAAGNSVLATVYRLCSSPTHTPGRPQIGTTYTQWDQYMIRGCVCTRDVYNGPLEVCADEERAPHSKHSAALSSSNSTLSFGHVMQRQTLRTPCRKDNVELVQTTPAAHFERCAFVASSRATSPTSPASSARCGPAPRATTRPPQGRCVPDKCW